MRDSSSGESQRQCSNDEDRSCAQPHQCGAGVAGQQKGAERLGPQPGDVKAHAYQDLQLPQSRQQEQQQQQSEPQEQQQQQARQQDQRTQAVPQAKYQQARSRSTAQSKGPRFIGVELNPEAAEAAAAALRALPGQFMQLLHTLWI